MPGKSFGSNFTPAIRSVAASWPQELYCPPCPFGFRRSYLVFMHPNHAFVRTRIRSAGLLWNLRSNIVRDIPNALPSISCLRLTSAVTSALTKNASRRNPGLCARWSCVLWRNSFRVGGFKGASRASAAPNVGRSIFRHILAAPEISAPAGNQFFPSLLFSHDRTPVYPRYPATKTSHMMSGNSIGCS